MSGWSGADERVLALPSGRRVRGRGLRAHPEVAPDPEFGLYLLATPVSGVRWAHEWVEWTDFGLPADQAAADRAILSAWGRARFRRVEVACKSGVGRTGTVLACMATLEGLEPAEAIEHIRSAYDPAAVETAEQADYVAQFAARHTPRSAGAQRLVRASAYAVCVHDNKILLSHQVSAGPAQGKWTLPGGGIGFGEDPAAAAVRECVEETGLTPILGPVLGIHSNTYVAGDGVERHGIRILYAGSFPDGRPTPTSPEDDEIDAVGWFDCDALPAPITEWATLGAELRAASASRTTQAPSGQPSSGSGTK